MSRVLSVSAAVVLIAAGAVFVHRERGSTAKERWYHASDVAQLGRTGRPQLVEFFHPD